MGLVRQMHGNKQGEVAIVVCTPASRVPPALGTVWIPHVLPMPAHPCTHRAHYARPSPPRARLQDAAHSGAEAPHL